MKDIRGKDIKVGDHIMYIRSLADRSFEDAIVVVSEEEYIQIEYIRDDDHYQKHKKGRRGKITATAKKVIILSLDGEARDNTVIDAYNKEQERWVAEKKKLNSKLTNAYHREKCLMEKIEELQAEVDKIHNRWSILDL